MFVDAATRLAPKLIDFGELLFAEMIGQSVKEMWVNVLDTGGRQAMHNHANSFCRWRGVPDAAPPTAGKRRNTMAFNAIPTRLDSWGHAITFGG